MRHVLLFVVAFAAPATAQTTDGVYVASDGVRVRCVTRGSGPPLVLLHGFALNAEMNWVGPGAVDSLAGAFTVIAFDLRGHGASGKPHDSTSYGLRYVSDIVGVLDQLNIAKAHFAGYSMGGIILLTFITMHPDRVRSAVLGGAGWQPPGPPRGQLVAWIENLDRAAREGSSVSAALSIPGLPPLTGPVAERLDRNDPAALAAVLRSAPALHVPEAQVRTLRVPVHAVVGEADAGARAAVDALVRLVPRVTVTLVPGADHRVAMAHPKLASAIRAFAQAQ